jgi:hypothetical protein
MAVRVASFGIRNPSLSRTGLTLHRINFVSSQRWLLHLRKARAVAGRTGMLSDLGRHGNLSGRLGWRPHFLAYCSTELARYLRAGANRSSGSSCLRACRCVPKGNARETSAIECQIWGHGCGVVVLKAIEHHITAEQHDCQQTVHEIERTTGPVTAHLLDS